MRTGFLNNNVKIGLLEEPRISTSLPSLLTLALISGFWSLWHYHYFAHWPRNSLSSDNIKDNIKNNIKDNIKDKFRDNFGDSIKDNIKDIITSYLCNLSLT